LDIISLQEAKKLKKIIGNTSELTTNSKVIVNAINEIKSLSGYTLTVNELNIGLVEQNQIKQLWMPFIKNGFIKGIKCTGQSITGEFILSLFTRPPNDGGKLVYYSGVVNNILWDIMDIPFFDESGTNDVYVVLENRGVLSNFNLQIFSLRS